MNPTSVLRLSIFVTLLAASACGRSTEPPPSETSRRSTPATAASATAALSTRTAPAPEGAQALVGDATRGKRWMTEFECSRCHDGTGLEPLALERHCVHCHEQIASGKVRAAPKTLAKWQKNVAYVRYVPSLEGVKRRFRAAWIAEFLREPIDLRPALAPSMPRLALTAQQAADIAAHLTAGAPAEKRSTLEPGSRDEGKRLFSEKSCGRCHAFSGTDATAPDPAAAASERDRQAILLAPDLRHTRERFRPDALERWLRSPTELKPDTLMPNHGLLPSEARSLARHVMETPLAPEAPPAAAQRPATTDDPVTYADVRDRVLSKTCGHCHGNPDVALGDGGPGHTGGFGFPARKLDLTRYGSIASGYVAADGERHSVFEPLEDGTPRLVAALLARHDEVAGKPHDDVRGMPLGLPPVPMADIALVDAWVRQGRPR
jgi:cytochrome c2